MSGANWNEFSFQFNTAVGSANPEIRKIFELVPKIGKDNDWDLFFHDLEDWTDEEALNGGPRRSTRPWRHWSPAMR